MPASLPYPAWICIDCGVKYGRYRSDCATFHEGECGWCKKQATVTEPRDYGFPKHIPTRRGNARH